MIIKAILIDDEQNNIEYLQSILAQQFSQVQVVACADSAAAAYNAISLHHPDLLFLDIQMPGESGFDLLRKFDRLDFEIIFITAYDQYGIQAIKFSALDYLLKPINMDELEMAIEKAVDKISKKQKNLNLDNLLAYLQTNKKELRKIALPLQNEIRYVPIASICRFEASNNYTRVFIENGETLLVCKTLKEFAGILKSCDFIRTHQSHLVNIHFVKSYLKEDGGILLLNDKIKIPISKAHREEVKKYLQQVL